MQQKKLLLHNKRMFEVMDYVISHKIRGVENPTDFFREIKNESKITNRSALKLGTSSFTTEDITNCIQVFGIDANYIFIDNYKVMFRQGIKVSPFQQLLQAVQRIGVETGAFDEMKEESEAVKLKRSVDKIEAEEKRKKDNYEFS